MQELLMSKEDGLPEQQEWNQSLDQKDPEPSIIKEELEELGSEDEEKPQSSQFQQTQRDRSTELELLSSDSTEQRTLKIEADGGDCAGSQPDSESGPCTHLQPDADDVDQLLVIKEETLSEQRERNLSVDQEDIKEEQEKLWISQQGEQLHQLEEAVITKFPFTVVPVKIESDDEKPQSSQVHQSQSDASIEVGPVASSSTVHTTWMAQSIGEDDGGPNPANISDVDQLLVIKEETLSEQRERNLSVDQEDIKEEQEKLWISQQGEQLHQLEEAVITKFPFTVVPVKIESDDEKPQSSQVHQSQSDASIEVGPVASSSTVHTTWMAQSIGEDDGGPNPANISDMQQCNLSIDHDDIKEDQEDLWINQQGEQLHQLEEADITKFPFIAVTVKTEIDEKPELSQVYQNQSDESTEAEPVVSSSSVHRTLTAEAEGEDNGGPKPATNYFPYSHLQSDASGRSSDSSVTETNNSCEWKQTRELHSRFNCRIKGKVYVGHSGSNISKKQFNPSQYLKACGPVNYSKQHTGLQATEKPFCCPECGKRFRHKSSLITHKRIHTGEKTFGCSECGTRFGGKSQLITHMRIHTGQKPFHCSECGKRFGQRGNLSTHMRTHTGQKLFHCSECGKRFGHKNSLIIHMRIHAGEKPFGCSECGKRFGHKSSLIIHMRIHTGEKPFYCSECGRRFGRKSHLVQHMRIHTGAKPFHCSECGQRFGQKSSLITHTRTHIGLKPFGCSECGRGFGHKSSLIKHIRIHTGEKPFACSECGTTFRNKGHLIIHMTTHSGEKPFACSECDTRFGRKGSLIRHMRIHMEEKPFACSECGTRFGRKSSLIRHMKNHTEMK
ncbi:zinc finger protein 135-like [Thalassophryne amazonica]|uniref:zinc finger protein 135-like n=1 Tax=Thalassophryne amazonica TaxID=390379 RepID=UPI0014718C36|nr:zinc finger protein 135-like [Thalassophryne amazonica]XP_034020259.1 zinc finger protein 135-like [Thalassophryne amazonica]XP_034020260.1 zinc finger protein 135-like [Thalassophryne amazonica]